VDGFRGYLAALPSDDRERLGVRDPARFSFRDEVRAWMAGGGPGSDRKPEGHPLWRHWSVYQGRGAAAFMLELRELAARTAGHPVPVGANAGLLWPGHLVDYQALDLFTAETDHHAATRKPSDLPLVAETPTAGSTSAARWPRRISATGSSWPVTKRWITLWTPPPSPRVAP